MTGQNVAPNLLAAEASSNETPVVPRRCARCGSTTRNARAGWIIEYALPEERVSVGQLSPVCQSSEERTC